ncbi:MAG: type IV conjugative transfer system protein TraL [Candidatus Altiarchaeota archaeon]|nr:type IV conjugative transfer system protein TraL [Candidatus Altiarchaeota archaeon]
MQIRFPQYLSSPIQVLWFEADELGIILLFFTLAFLFGNIFYLLMFLGPYVYAKVKTKYPSGFLQHLFYFTGLTRLNFYPDSFTRTFIE